MIGLGDEKWKMEVTKCLLRTDGIKYCIIPKKSNIEKGDSIAIIKLNEEDIKNAKRRKDWIKRI